MRNPPAVVAVLVVVGLASVVADDVGGRLRKAAEGGRVDQVEQLLQQGAPVDAADKRGRTAIVLAAGKGHVAVVQALLGAGTAQARAAREAATLRKRAEVVTLVNEALERPLASEADARVKAYVEGVTVQDDVLKDFPRDTYKDRELALLMSGSFKIQEAPAGDDEPEAAPDYGMAQIGYYRGTGAATYTSAPKAFVVLRELYFLKGVLSPKAAVRWAVDYRPYRSTALTSGLGVQLPSGRSFELSRVVRMSIAPVDASNNVDTSRPDLVRHVTAFIRTPVFVAQ